MQLPFFVVYARPAGVPGACCRLSESRRV